MATSLVWRQPAQALLRARTSHGCVLSAQCFASTYTTSTTSGDDTTPALTPLQRARLSLQAAAGALADPSRADLVAALGETTGDFALRAMARRLNNTPHGRGILETQPLFDDAFYDACARAPPSTLGAAYHTFMTKRGFHPSERPAVRYVSNDDARGVAGDLKYVMLRYRQVHDIWHVLFGLNTTVFGELVLKAIEARQTGLPMCYMSAFVAPAARLPRAQRERFYAVYLPWAWRAGNTCVDLMAVDYNEAVEKPLEDVRREWRISVAPAQVAITPSSPSSGS